MKVLILGSDGQIGRPLSNYIKLFHDVVEFDIYSNDKNDLRILNVLDNILPTIDFVYFLSFDVGGSTYLNTYQNSYEFISNNVKIMDNTFSSLSKYNTPFIFISSSMSNMLYSTYGMLKNIGEQYTKSMSNGKIVRFWNVYGFEKISNKTHVITDFINMAKLDHKIIMKTNGEESRQFLYIEDCCKCLHILMDPNIKEKEFDVSSFKWEKIIDIAKIISSNFNNCQIIMSDKRDIIQLNSFREPSTLIYKYWHPETLIEDGIKKIISLYEKNN